MNTDQPESKLFLLLANRRTGSNYLMKLFDSFPEVEFFGEVYHRDTVWMPPNRKKEYITWLKNTKNISLNIGENPGEDSELVKFNHANPKPFLKFLSSTTTKKYAGFKIFPEHLSWQKMEENLLSNKNITKIILRRNLLDVYISDKILRQTKRSQEYDTSNIKINIDCVDFKKWYYDTQSYYSRIELYLKNNSQQYSELSYEDIHSYNNDKEKVEYIYSWLNKHGFDIKDKPKRKEYTKKQDLRKKTLTKVNNVPELTNYLQRNHLHYLTHN